MKPNRLYRSALVSTMAWIFISSIAFAGEPAEGEPSPGFFGNIFIGGGYSSGDFSLEDASEDDNKTISSLSQSPKSHSGFDCIVEGELNYLFPTGTVVSLDMAGGAGLNMEGGYGLGVSQFTDDLGLFSLAGYYSDTEVWADPFVTGKPRFRTDRETMGIALGWEGIMETDFSLHYGFEDVDVENDISGNADRRVKRGGNIHHLGVNYILFCKDTHELTVGLLGEIGDIDGEAYAFKGGQIELSHTFQGNDWDFSTGVYWGKRDYDAIHPSFGQTREDTRYGADAAYTLYNPFGLERYYLSVFAGYEKEDSNIRFYEQSGWNTGFGVGFRF